MAHIIHILNIFDHTILPTHNSHSHFLIDTIVVISSGRDVHNAITVNQMTLSDIHMVFARFTACSTTISLPNISANKPHITIRPKIHNGYLLFSSGNISCCLLV